MERLDERFSELKRALGWDTWVNRSVKGPAWCGGMEGGGGMHCALVSVVTSRSTVDFTSRSEVQRSPYLPQLQKPLIFLRHGAEGRPKGTISVYHLTCDIRWMLLGRLCGNPCCNVFIVHHTTR